MNEQPRIRLYDGTVLVGEAAIEYQVKLDEFVALANQHGSPLTRDDLQFLSVELPAE